MTSTVIRIGTRGSPLARAQTDMVRGALLRACGLEPDQVRVEVIRTSGDRIQDRPLREVGGKGLFTKEIEEALLAREIDLAVHSVKDMEAALPAGLALVGVLEREDPRDALISARAASLAALPRGARLGTSSLRRQAQVKRLRPDIEVLPLRGNVETRLAKLAGGELDATLLALAGLRRLGIEDRATAVLEPDEMLPAVGQGAVGLEARVDDARIRDLAAPLLDADTGICIAAERAFLGRLGGSCNTPVAGHARVMEGVVRLRAMVLAPDGSRCHEAETEGTAAEAEAVGMAAAEELIAAAGPAFLESLR